MRSMMLIVVLDPPLFGVGGRKECWGPFFAGWLLRDAVGSGNRKKRLSSSVQNFIVFIFLFYSAIQLNLFGQFDLRPNLPHCPIPGRVISRLNAGVPSIRSNFLISRRSDRVRFLVTYELGNATNPAFAKLYVGNDFVTELLRNVTMGEFFTGRSRCFRAERFFENLRDDRCRSEFSDAKFRQNEGKERISKTKTKQFQSGLQSALGQKCLFFFLQRKAVWWFMGFSGATGMRGRLFSRCFVF